MATSEELTALKEKPATYASSTQPVHSESDSADSADTKPKETSISNNSKQDQLRDEDTKELELEAINEIDTDHGLPTISENSPYHDHHPLQPTIETIELPRDILTAYILIHLTGMWEKYSCIGKIGICFAVATPFTIQYTVAITLLSQLDIQDADKITQGDPIDIWFNIITLSVLFIYMFRDLNSYWKNVWYFIGKIEDQQQIKYNPLRISKLKRFGKKLKKFDYRELNPGKFNVEKQFKRLLFIQFRLEILAVVALYVCVTVYSLVQIAVTDGLAEKLEVSLAIFFLLEVDDWSYDLFISQNGILEDSQFDIDFELEKPDNKFKDDTKKIWISLWILYGSMAFVLVYSILYVPDGG